MVPGSRPPRQNRQSARAERMHLPLTPRGSPPTRLLPTCVLPGGLPRAPSRVRALRSLEAPLLGRGGASVCGAGRDEREPSRELPSGAERSRGELRGAGERQAEPAGGSAPFVLRFPSCCPPPCLCPGTCKTFIVSGTPPPGCVTKSQRSAVSSPSSPAAAIEGTCNPRHRALAPCASSPADRSRGTRGGSPTKGPRGHRHPEILFTVRTGSAQL